MAPILSGSKNMCSVLQSQIHSAPNSLALAASVGVSALVLTFNFLYLSAQAIILQKSPETLASTVGIAPSYIFPVVPSIEIISPSWYSFPHSLNVLFSSSIIISVHPETQHLPIPRATTAA